MRPASPHASISCNGDAHLIDSPPRLVQRMLATSTSLYALHTHISAAHAVNKDPTGARLVTRPPVRWHAAVPWSPHPAEQQQCVNITGPHMTCMHQSDARNTGMQWTSAGVCRCSESAKNPSCRSALRCAARMLRVYCQERFRSEGEVAKVQMIQGHLLGRSDTLLFGAAAARGPLAARPVAPLLHLHVTMPTALQHQR